MIILMLYVLMHGAGRMLSWTTNTNSIHTLGKASDILTGLRHDTEVDTHTHTHSYYAAHT